MISLRYIDNNNYQEALKLKLREVQKAFVAEPMEILARAYIYRDYNSRVYAIYYLDTLVGLCLVCDLDDIEPCYELQEFMIGDVYQNKGYGTLALKQLISLLQKQGKYSSLEVCVNREDSFALNLYADLGFIEAKSPRCNNSKTLKYIIG